MKGRCSHTWQQVGQQRTQRGVYAIAGHQHTHAGEQRRVSIRLAAQAAPVRHGLSGGRRVHAVKPFGIRRIKRLHALWAGTQTVQGLQGHGQVAGELVLVFGGQLQLGVQQQLQCVA